MAKYKQPSSADNGGLFDEFVNQESMEEKGQVTVLGITFENDDARRQYFREQLRAKLPELRNIEGFPIGSDDDIINLSDPPYYTACPNPWINDFIAEWEKEKQQLEVNGLRSSDIIVEEPYASDVSEGKANPIYLAHAYHTKVPHPAIMRYILHYTQPGDIIFDGFCGTGMTAVAANLCSDATTVNNIIPNIPNKAGKRHAICSDLSPIATHIAANFNKPFNATSFRRKAMSALDKVEAELGWMYETNVGKAVAKINTVVWSDVFVCTSCGCEINFWNEAVNEASKEIKDSFNCPNCGANCSKKNLDKFWVSDFDKIINSTIKINKKVPVKINYSLNGHRGDKIPDEQDLLLLDKIENLTIRNPRTDRLLVNGYNTRQPINSNGINYTHQFYTKRAFAYFSHLFDIIDDDITLRAWLTSALISTTKMNRFRFSGTGVNAGTLFVPSLNWEFSPYNTLKSKIEAFINANYEGRGNSVIGLASATRLTEIKENSIDYIFTDPPFGANIMYSEISSIWEAWLRVRTNNTSEAIVNDSQNKGLIEYQHLMRDSLAEYFRILKPGKWITIEFSNTSASVWNSIQTALQNVGFVVANVSALDKKQGSFKAVTTTTAVKQDLIISCFKPSDKMLGLFNNSTNSSENVWDFTNELLSHLPIHIEREHKTTSVVERNPKILYDRLISYYVQRGLPVPIDAREFQKGLRERFLERDGMFFTADQAFEYEDKKNKTIGFEAAQVLFVSSEAEGIEWLKRELKEPKTYADITNPWKAAQLTPKKGDVIPELKTILEENFIEDENGQWRVPNPEKEADLEKIRNRRLAHEFKAIVELAMKPKGRIKDARLEALRYGFKEAYRAKEFNTIVTVAQRLPEALVMEDEDLLRYYDIAINHV